MMSDTFGRHRSICRSLKRHIDSIREIAGVDRVILGLSRGCRHNRPVGSVRVQAALPTGIKLVGYSDRGVTEFTVITSDVPTVRKALMARYGGPHD